MGAAEPSVASGTVILAIAVAGLLLAGTYLFLGRSVLFSRRALYALLRAGALALVAFALFRPERITGREVTSRHTLAVLVDNSRSMRFPLSARSARRRLDALEGLLRTRERDFEALSRRYDVRAYSFDRDLVRRPPGAGPVSLPAADGPSTALGEALIGALDAARGGKLAGIVVISDGRSNLGVSPADSARQLEREGVPVYALALGDGLPFADLRVAALDAPSSAAIGKPVTITAHIQARAVEGGTTVIVLRAGGKEIGRRAYRLRRGDSAGEVHFTHVPAEAGTLVIEAAAEPLPGEFVRANNRRLAFVDVEDTTLRVVYVEGMLRQDYRAIRRALAGASGIDLDVVRAFTRREPEGPRGEFARVRWDEYDVFVIGELPGGLVPRPAAEKVTRLVVESGRGLVVLSGPEAMRTSPFRALLPLRITDYRPAPSATVVPTHAGGDHPALRIAERAADARDVWARMGTLGDRPRAVRTSPGAEVLLAAGDGEPVLVTARRGTGRTAALLSGRTHVWADAPGAPRGAHARLVRSMVAWSAGRDSARAVISVELGRHRLHRGDLVTIIARVNRTRARELGLTDAEIDALGLRAAVHGPVPPPAAGRAGEAEAPLAGRTKLERAFGQYEGSLVAREGGVFRVRVEPARPDKRLASPAETLFVVADDDRELARTSADPAVLREVCETTGGVFARAGRPEAVFRALLKAPAGRTVTVSRRASVWDVWWVAVLFVCALCAEWWLRRP